MLAVVQRRASNTGAVVVAGQVALGRVHAHTVVTVHAAETALTIEAGGGTRTVTRTTTKPVRYVKAARPRKTLGFMKPSEKLAELLRTPLEPAHFGPR